MKFRFIVYFLFLLSPLVVQAKQDVKLGTTTIFSLERGIGAFTLQERVNAIEARISGLASSSSYNADKLVVSEFENSTNILYEDRVIITITDLDSKALNISRSAFAKTIKAKISTEIEIYKKNNSWKSIALSIAYVLLSTLVLFFLLNFLSRFFPNLVKTSQSWSLKHIPSLKIKNYELLPSSRFIDLIVFLFKAGRIVLTLTLLYLYIPLVFSFFPYTSGWADKIFGYVSNPLKNIASVVIDYIPNLFFVAVIFILTAYFLRFLRFIFKEIERGSIQFEGFYKEWADPTYKLVRFLVLIFALVVVFPYLPGSGSPAFQGISVFLGLLISFGSSSAISNVVAGVVLTYMRPFRIKDRVKIADTVGDVVEKSLLVTRVRTTKNVDITIPNSMVLGSHLVNYSSSAQEHGLIVHPQVTIGYDVDWRKVHELLLAAAGDVEFIKSEPKPFVLQTSLDDFYVSYELNAYTDKPNALAAIYSELYKSIQDKFAAAGVEIMSPHFSAIRDGSNINIPATSDAGTQFVQGIRVSQKDL